MSLFGGGIFSGGLFGGPFFDPPNPIDQAKKVAKTMEALTTDQKTEGKKEGYDDAAREYEPIYRDLKTKYDSLISDIERKKQNFDKKSEDSLLELEKLEKERDELDANLKSKVKEASSSFNVSSGAIMSALSSNSGVAHFGPVFDYSIMDAIIGYKEKQRREARKEGYLEARSLYEKKIEKLKKDYEKVKTDASRKTKKYAEDMGAILDEIHSVKMQIADLELAMME